MTCFIHTGDCSIKDGKLGIHMTMSREGRPSGEAYVEMETDEDIEKACKKDRDHMGHRYIEGMYLCCQHYILLLFNTFIIT
jgi:heterogeneous nuclear ribonucleoprotein F/H